jgi:lysophospholipase L1-like esterase
MVSNAYITGTGRLGATTSNGNADVLTSTDGVHPSPAGHDTLARVLLHRYAAALPA